MAEKLGRVIKIFCVVLVFVFAIFLRIWNLNQMGRTWDELFYVNQGHGLIDIISKGDFANSLWYTDPDPPAFAKYLYGIASHLDVNKIIPCENELCSYDFTASRLVSVLFSSLTILLVVLIGWEYVSFFVGVLAGVILSTLPIFLGLSQLVTIESILIFFFTSCVYSFLHLLKTFSIKNTVICGILLGLAIGTKYTNIILVPLFMWIYFIWTKYKASKDHKKLFNNKLLLLVPISIITFFVIWPIPWFHLPQVWEKIYSVRFSEVTSHPSPEVFFGRLMPVPIPYYFVYLLITTPFLIFLLFLGGLKKISDDKKWILYVFVAWFLLPFVQSFINMKQHGIRYIIEIYVPLSIISAIGFNYFIEKFKVKKLKLVFLSFLVLYMLAILKNISPYYLDYFNIVVGGAKGVYQSRFFQLGWWGQGIREAGLYISNNARKGSKIGLAISPATVMPQLKNFDIKQYREDDVYDYIVVNHYNILREGFDDSKIKKAYNAIYIVWADGAKLVIVYKKK